METLSQASGFGYDSGDAEGDIILEVFVHHARNIHNICIYNNQDVYAKFSLTYNPDETTSTRVVVGGGKNPEFNQKLELKVNQIDAVLKCEIWMFSRVRNLLEDQLLGFALVPISQIASQGGTLSCHDFSLSSTDLLHSPAGTVQLSVSLSSANKSSVSAPLKNTYPSFSGQSSITSEVILLDRNEYSSVEFPDINAAAEDQLMASEYFNLNLKSDPARFRRHSSFLHLLQTGDDYEMVANSSEDNENENENENSANWSNRNSGVLSSVTTCLNDDRNTADSNPSASDQTRAPPVEETGAKQSKGDKRGQGGIEIPRGDRTEVESNKMEKGGLGYGNLGRVFPARVGSTDIEAEQAAMQQQIVDMYMKSMQQFTDSLSKMKLPMGLDPNPDDEDLGNVIRIMENNKLETENSNTKKDGSRVFYGSRAFF